MHDSYTAGHKSVLVKEVLEYLVVSPGKTYLDVTFGAGGHTRAILESDPTARVIALDWDTRTLERYAQPLQAEFGDRLMVFWGSFAHLYKILKKEQIVSVDGILADFGTSQMQIFERAGFSIFTDTDLDMRMSPAHYHTTAADVLNTATESKLAKIFFDFGQERYARRVARAIVESRARRKFTTTKQLRFLIEQVIGFSPTPRGKQKIHPATRVFQALRIYVNSELENITAFLHAAPSYLTSGGRLVCISFHSLEDVLVKDFFNEQESLGNFDVVTKKVVVASAQELQQNPSARSAKLRAASKR